MGHGVGRFYVGMNDAFFFLEWVAEQPVTCYPKRVGGDNPTLQQQKRLKRRIEFWLPPVKHNLNHVF